MATKIIITPELDEEKLRQQLNDIKNKKEKITVDINSENINNVNTSMKKLNNTVASSNTAFGKLKSTISNTFSGGKLVLTGYLAALNEIRKASKNAKEAIEEISEATMNLQVSSGLAREQVQELIKDYNAYGKSLGSTTTQITDAADNYLRSGKTLKEASELIKSSTILSKLGKLDSSEATNDILAVMNGYNMSINGVNKAIDAMVKLDMSAAVSSGEIATAMQYVASNANAAGISFDKLASMIAVVRDRTRLSAESIGTAFNTIISRYKDITIGEYLDSDGEEIGNTEKVLRSLGVELRDENKEFRSFETVLDELAKSWDSYSSVQQAAIAKQLAGTRQQNKFIALISNYNKVLELTEVSADSAGIAVEKFNEAYMNSLESKKNQLQSSFESLVINTNFEEVYASILDTTMALVDFINQTNALKGAMTGLMVAGSIKAFLTIKTGVTEAYIALNKFQNALNISKVSDISTQSFEKLLLLSNGLSTSQMKLVLSTNSLTVAQKQQLLMASGLSAEEAALQLETWGMTAANTGLTTATTTLGNTFKGLWATLAANPLIVVTAAVSAVVMAYQSYSQKLKETRQANIDNATAASEHTDELKKQYDEYMQLASIQDRTTSQEEEFKTAIDNIIVSLGSKADVLKDLTAGTDEYADALARVTKEELQGQAVTATIGRKASQEELQDKIWSDWSGSQVAIDSNSKGKSLSDETQKAVAIVSESLKKYETVNRTWKNISWDINSDDPVEALEYYNSLIEARGKLVSASKDDETLLDTEIYEDLNTVINSMSESLDTYIENLYEEQKLSYMSKNGIPKTIEEYKAMELALVTMAGSSVDLQNSFKELLASDFSNFTTDIENTSDALVDVAEQVENINIPSFSVSDTINQLNTQLKPAFDSLKSAYQDIFTNDGFTLENVDISMLDSIRSSIEELNSIEDVNFNIDYTSFENLSKVLTDSSSTAEDVHDAMNSFATDIVSALNPALSECSGEAYLLVQSLLESIGVMNSEEVMISALGYTYEEYIAAKQECANEGFNLANATESEIDAFIQEQGGAENCGIALATLQLKKLLVNNTSISTVSDVEQILSLASAANISANSLVTLAKAKAQFENAQANGDKLGMSLAARGMKEAGEKVKEDILNFKPVNVDFSPTGNKSGGSKKEKDTTKEFDWIENAIKNLEDEISKLDKIVDSSYSSISEKNKALIEQIVKINEEISLQQQAYEQYMAKADSVGLSDEYKALVQNGSVNIEEITDQNLQEAISNYTEWYDKVKETQDKINDLHKAAKDKHVEGYKLELEELERLRDDQTITEREYLDGMLLLYEKYYADQVEFANQAKEAKLKYLKEEKDYLETVANAAVSLLDDQIDELEEDKDKAREKYEKQIESIEIVVKERQKEIEVIQDQIDVLEDENDEIDRQQKLQKALYDQQRALNQKSQLTYKDGQMSYDIDYSALKDADNDVRDAQKDITIANLQKQIDSIQDGIDELEIQKTKLEELADESDAYFDAKIKNLQNYQNKWKEVTEFEERAIAIENLKSMFGEDAVAQILSGNTKLISDFCQEYVDTMAAIDLVNSGTISSITSEWEKLSGVSVNMEHARELSELSIDALSSKAESLGITMQTVQDSSKNMEDSLNNTDTSKINEQLQSTGTEVVAMKDRVNSVVNELNNLATEVSAYEIPPINTEQFTSSLGIENNSGILGQLNSFIEKFREICEAIPSIWNGAMSSISRQESVPGESVGYDVLFIPLINAMDGAKNKIDNKLKEYADLWTDFNKTLGEIIGTGGGTDKGGKDSSGKKGANLTGSPDGANKGANKEGGSDSIVGTIESGGEAVTQSLNEVWVPGFESFATRVDEICMSVCSMMEDMANEVIDMVNAALKALKELEAKNTGAYKIKKVSSSYSSHPVMASNAYGTLSSATGRGAITKDQESIVNELGNEMIARDGVLHEIQGGTQKVQLKKGDVVFNHKQTQELKKYNRVKSGGGRGKLIGSFVHGSASTKSIDIKNIENGIAGLFNDDLFKKVIDMLEKLKIGQDTIIQQNKDKTYPEGTIVTSDGQVLTPLPDDHPLIQLQKKFDNFMQQMGGMEELNINAMARHSRQMDEMVRQINNVNSITNNRNIQPVISIGDINVTCPGVTSQEVMKEVGDALGKQIGHLAQRAIQEPLRRY